MFYMQTWKKTNFMNFLKYFPPNFSFFSVKFGFLNVQFRNYLKNVIFIAYKGCKICKWYVNSIVISCSTSQNGEKCIWVKYLIYAVLSQFSICRNLRVFFCQIFTSKVSEFTIFFFSKSVYIYDFLLPFFILTFAHNIFIQAFLGYGFLGTFLNHFFVVAINGLHVTHKALSFKCSFKCFMLSCCSSTFNLRSLFTLLAFSLSYC